MSASNSPFRSESNDPTNRALPPDRLWEAVDAALDAVEDVAEYTGGKRFSPLELLGSPLQPARLSQFTRYEIEEATKFLIRMGALPAGGAAGAARDN